MIFIKKLKFCYTLQADYSNTVTRHSFSAMLLPSDSNRQLVEKIQVEIENCNKYYITKDNYGNQKFYSRIDEPHNTFKMSVTGIVKTGIDIFEEYTFDPTQYSLLKYQTPLTYPYKRIREYHKKLKLNDFSSDYEKSLHIMRSIFNDLKYVQGATQIHSTAEDALKLGEGVCQDYAHIMLSLLRMENIPARYVVGIMQGEGASHAWVEVLCKGYWYGFDPTNNKLINDEYIKISCGRDSSDCAVIRGTFRGVVTQNQSESVLVEEV
ncbi:MAG: transglutaminase family protein [Acutalibacteraceae bacterium]|nr:transglutaminase family protein [Acutalibacteraceae bacterium]